MANHVEGSDASSERDPQALVARLVALSSSMTADEKRAAAERLHAAGLTVTSDSGQRPPSPPPHLAQGSAQALQATLGHGPKDTLDPARALELARLTADFAASMDKGVWLNWKKLAPNSKIKRTGNAKTTMARFAAGDPDVSQSQLEQELKRMRDLAVGIMSAIEDVGRQFAQHHLSRFAPGEIESAAKIGKGAMTAIEAACWRKYVELAAPRDSEAIEEEVRGVVAEYTEKFISGLERRA